MIRVSRGGSEAKLDRGRGLFSRLYAKAGSPILLLALATLLISYGGADHDAQSEKDRPDSGQAQGTDHGNKGKSGGTSGMEGTDHGPDGMASGMLMKNGRYSDERSSMQWSRTTRGPSTWPGSQRRSQSIPR
jgi:hypothetical protein